MTSHDLQARLRRLESAKLPATGKLDSTFVMDLFLFYGEGSEADRAAAAERAVERGWTVEELARTTRLVYDALKAEAGHGLEGSLR
jgi:hypothetical protein